MPNTCYVRLWVFKTEFMKYIFKIIKYENPKTYYCFTFFDLKLINSYQVFSLNFTFCNLFFKIIKEKNE